MGHITGLPDPADGYALRGRFLENVERDADALRGGRGHVGGDEAGRDRVGGDTELAEFDGQGLGEALQPGLGRGVVDLAAVAERGRGGQVDDAPEPLTDHVLLHGPGHLEGAAQVHAHNRVPVVVGHLEQQVVADHAGVVHQHGRLAQFGGHPLDRGPDLVAVAHVGTHRERAAARVGDLLHRPGAGGLVQVEDGHGHPVRGQPARGRGTDTAGRAGHDRDSLCHLCSSLLTPERARMRTSARRSARAGGALLACCSAQVVALRSSRRARDLLCTSSGPSAKRSVRALAHRWASGKSWLTPPPPCAWMARSITHCAIAGVTILIAWISACAPLLPTVSISHAVLSTSSRACSIRTLDSAIQSWITPCSARGLPNAVRLTARRHMSSRARSAAPISRMQWWMRPGPSRACAIANPVPSPEIRFSRGTRTLSKTTSACPPCVPSV